MGPFTAVVTTGIYCRPGCPGRPRRENVTTFAYAAAAEAAGYRACLRCRPYRAPQPVASGSSALVCRAVRLILDGALDNDTETGLAAKLGVSGRQLRRLFTREIGVTPDGLARSSRTHFARRLLDDTDLSVSEIAFAAGFGSVRQLNRAVLDVFRATPTCLRTKRRLADRLVADGGLPLRLPFSGTLDWPAMLTGLAQRAVPGVEHVDGATYRRIVVVDGDPGVLELRSGESDSLVLVAHLPHWAGLLHVVQKARRIANLDAPPMPGELRQPGSWDPFEVGIRTLLTRATDSRPVATLMAEIAARYGAPVPGLRQLQLTHAFPAPHTLARADLTEVGLSVEQGRAIVTYAEQVERSG